MNLNAIARAHRTLAVARKQLADANLDVTVEHVVVLSFLQIETAPVRMTSIAKYLQVTPAVATGLVDRLEKRKLVERSNDKVDRRVTLVDLTADGESVLFRAAATMRVDEKA